MSKKDFVALANLIRDWNAIAEGDSPKFTKQQISVLAEFCNSSNPAFNRDHWLGYIAGTNGPSGGKR